MYCHKLSEREIGGEIGIGGCTFIYVNMGISFAPFWLVFDNGTDMLGGSLMFETDPCVYRFIGVLNIRDSCRLVACWFPFFELCKTGAAF